MSRDARFWDRNAEKYAKSKIKDEAAYQTKLAKTREYFTPDSEVLEFGCGTGSTAILHAPHVRHILATDVSGEMLRIAQGKTEAAGIENITYRQSSFEDLDLPPDHYDVVLGLSILHLLDDWKTAIARIYETTKPGGVFVSSTACIANGMSWFALIAPIGRALGVFPLVRIFKADDVEAALRDAGFEVEHRWQPEKSIAAFMVARKPG